MDNYNDYVNDYMNSYNCPDCNEAKLQSDKNARKINEVIEQVNQIIDNDIATTDYLLQKADKIVGQTAEIKVNEEMKEIKTEINNNKKSIEVEKKRIDTFTKLAEGSTTGDAELIDGRVGVNGLIYSNIGNAIRTQLKDQSDKINFYRDRTMYLESITSALEDSVISIDSVKIENLLYIDGYEVTKNGLSISIKDNVIYVDGIAGDYYYIKITNGFDIGYGPSGGNKKEQWCNEKYAMPLNEKYHLTSYKIDGTIENFNPDSPVVVSARNSNYTSILSTTKGLVELTEELAYIQLYIPPATYKKCRYGIVLQKDILSTKFTKYGYYNTTVNILDNGDNVVLDVPNNIIANRYKEINGTYFNAIQGACSDGKYIYYGIVNNQTDDDNTVVKMDINTKEIIKTTNELNLGHCNSMTYCSYDGFIHCVALDEEGTIHRITTELEYIDSYKVTILDKYPQFTGFGAIDYNEKREQFIFLIRGNKKGYAIFTKNMTFVKIIWCEYVDSHVYGGVCSDNNFIYQAICGNNFEGIISIFNFNGDLIKTIQLENFNGEIEESFLIKNKMYCSACRHDYTNHDIWELSLKNYQII